MARTRERSCSPHPSDSPNAAKRLKTSHISSSATTNGNGVNGAAVKAPVVASKPKLGAASIEVAAKSAKADRENVSKFHNGLFEHDNISRLHTSYDASSPFKHVVVDKLFQNDLLLGVKDECLRELSFTEKETDIYKVNQTGDLASLNYLSSSQLARLPNLLTLRDALYSKTFREFLQAVTGCGPLSGTKQDMSVNTYTRGCHLLNHDDVIGSRRVSYILYMPLPHYTMWQKDWGGALELYPVQMGEDGQPEPGNAPVKTIPPSWNQFIFFEVQPGKSFHSVEEVVVGGDGRERLSISGWFHRIQPGEEGYFPEPPAEFQSSREQLTSTSTKFTGYPSESEPSLPTALTDAQTSFLREFLNPVYLQPRTMKALAERFVEESSLELHSFLSSDIADPLENRLRSLDSKDGLGSERAGRIPPHSAGTQGSWEVRGPPHKWRYCTLKQRDKDGAVEAVTPRAANPSADANMRSLQDELFGSEAFRAWLSLVTKLIPMRHAVQARRFRPGLDYTLATSEEEEARLDVVLGLTPRVMEEVERESEESEGEGSNGSGKGYYRKQVASRGWQSAEWGGWECYMAPHNEEDDPAVYRSSVHKKSKGQQPPASPSSSEGSKDAKTNGNGNGKVNGHHGSDDDADMVSEPEEEEEAEEEDSTLLTVQPGYNRLLLVLRDERVMRFVKYVSAAAEGSRWDVCGEYEVGMVQEEESEMSS